MFTPLLSNWKFAPCIPASIIIEQTVNHSDWSLIINKKSFDLYEYFCDKKIELFARISTSIQYNSRKYATQFDIIKVLSK